MKAGIVANILADILVNLTDDTLTVCSKNEGYLIMVLFQKWNMIRESVELLDFS